MVNLEFLRMYIRIYIRWHSMKSQRFLNEIIGFKGNLSIIQVSILSYMFILSANYKLMDRKRREGSKDVEQRVQLLTLPRFTEKLSVSFCSIYIILDVYRIKIRENAVQHEMHFLEQHSLKNISFKSLYDASNYLRSIDSSILLLFFYILLKRSIKLSPQQNWYNHFYFNRLFVPSWIVLSRIFKVPTSSCSRTSQPRFVSD